MGVPPEAARDVLGRTGTLRDALNELGLEAPEGVAGGGGGGSGGGGGLAGDNAAASRVDVNDDDDDDDDDSEADSSSSGGEEGLDSEPTLEEKRLFEELAADRENQDDEGYLDITLEDESDAADMYILLCRGNIPVSFDLDKVRASVAAAAAAAAAAASAGGGATVTPTTVSK
ncbi:unnamed protein product [Ectocarpus sp. 12 AP-2014]